MCFDSVPLSKRCNTCQQVLPLSAFPRRKKGSKDGHRNTCGECCRKYQKLKATENKEKKREYDRQRYAEHAEERRESACRWQRDHPDAAKDKKRKWANKNRELLRKRLRQRSPEIHERDLERTRKWKREHPDRVRFHGAMRRANMKRAEGKYTPDDIHAQYRRQKGRCYYCGRELKQKYQVDHVVPLDRGGLNTPDNLVVACKVCNGRKSNKLPHEWPEGGRLL